MLDAYKKRKGDWNLYRQEFLELMRARGIERSASSDVVDGSCLGSAGQDKRISADGCSCDK
jgi:hypothetical protein